MVLQLQKALAGRVNEWSGQQVLPSAIPDLDILSLRSGTLASKLCDFYLYFFSPLCREGEVSRLMTTMTTTNRRTRQFLPSRHLSLLTNTRR